MRAVFIFIFISIFFVSCSKDEFSELKFEFNPYDSVDMVDAIVIQKVEVAEYFMNSNGIDTLAVKFFIDYQLNEKYFSENNISKPKYEVRADLYINEIRFIPRLDTSVNRYYVKEQFKHFKNNNNLMLYKLSLYKDPSDRTKRRIASNEYYFRVN